MSFRNAVAGPSRLASGSSCPAQHALRRPCKRAPSGSSFSTAASLTRIPRISVQHSSCPVHQVQVRRIHVPDPRTFEPPENMHFFIRTNERIASHVHALAIVQAAEQHLGRILEMDFQKDPHTGHLTSLVWVKLYQPYNAARGPKLPIHVEIPAPALRTTFEEMRCGGPSLEDLDRAWAGKLVDMSDTTGGRPLRRDGPSIRFSIHHAKKRDDRPSRVKANLAKRIGADQRRSPTEQMEDNLVLKALERVGDGMYGGFKGIYDQLKHLRTDLSAQGKDSGVLSGAAESPQTLPKKGQEARLLAQRAATEQKRAKARTISTSPSVSSTQDQHDPSSVWKRKRPTPHAKEKQKKRDSRTAERGTSTQSGG